MSSDVHGAVVDTHDQGFPSSGLKQPFHLVDPSPWPIIGAMGGGITVLGIVLAAHYGIYSVLVIGLLVVLTTMFFWWRNVIRESRSSSPRR
jgi:cytochrome c oxidase subunit 3